MTPAEQLARAITPDPEQRADGLYVPCPCHDDQHASLCITDKDGKTLWVCRAGCDQAQVTTALKPILARLNGTAQRKSQIVAEYPYHDEEGRHLFTVARFEPKTFRQWRPNPAHKDGKEWSLKGVRRVLYRLPDLVKANQAVIVEGEKDVEAIRELGLPATCNVGGAGKWRREYNEFLRGKRVAIIADRDAPGRKHAQQVAAALHGIASAVYVLEPPHPHKDAADWITAGAKRGDITTAIKATPEWTPAQAGESATYTAPAHATSPDQVPPWPEGLLCGDKGPRAILANAIYAVQAAPALQGMVSWDTFTERLLIQRGTPWGTTRGQRWTDYDDARLAEWLQHHDVLVGIDMASNAATTVAHRYPHDALIDHVQALQWDGKPRLAGLARYFGADPDSLSGELAKLWMISAVARAIRPGCQVDHVLVLEGPQGTLKSSALRVLFDPHDAGWFSDSLPSLDHKDAPLALVGTWCMEIAELEAVNAKRIELEKVKAFITRRVDHYRPPYGRHVREAPRRTVFAGSTNERQYLKDTTGNRRWWPMPCGRIRLDDLARDRDQLVAEAHRYFDSGATWWVEPAADNIGDVIAWQESRRQSDPWEAAIWAFLRGRMYTTADDVLDMLKVPMERRTQADTMRVGRIMLGPVGWHRKQFRKGGDRFWAYVADKDLELDHLQGGKFS